MNWTEKEYADLMARKGKPMPVLQTTKNIAAVIKQTPIKKSSKAPGVGKKVSYAEQVYRRDYLQPLILIGEIIEVEAQISFIVLPKCELCGQKLRERVFTPDFILHFKDGSVKVVEIKGTTVKKLQRDYPLRKHLFIEKYCAPNGWLYEEVRSELLTQKQ